MPLARDPRTDLHQRAEHVAAAVDGHSDIYRAQVEGGAPGVERVGRRARRSTGARPRTRKARCGRGTHRSRSRYVCSFLCRGNTWLTDYAGPYNWQEWRKSASV